MKPESKIYVAGHRGLVGSAIVRALQSAGHANLLLRTHAELDLTRQADVESFFDAERPEFVFLAAAKVGGIKANDERSAEFIHANLAIQSNVIHNAWRTGAKKLLFLGSSCIYPKHAPQPIKEEYLLTGPLEPTNDAYAIAKIAGIQMCQSYRKQYGADFICAMPTNLYGPNDNYDADSSHVLPALIRRFHEAKLTSAPSVTCWGTGTPRREFLHADDLARACLFLIDHYSKSSILNVGTGSDVTINELAEIIANSTGYGGHIYWDVTKQDGTPRKLMDSSKILKLGWKPILSLKAAVSEICLQYALMRGPRSAALDLNARDA